MSERVTLVLGATGNTGSAIVDGLLARGVPVRALTRNAGKAEALKRRGVQLAVGDLDDPAQLPPRLFDGVTQIYHCTWNGPTALDQWRTLRAAVQAAGTVTRVVRGSAFGAPQSRIIQQHEAADRDLKESGLAWTILRPTFFMQNTMMAAATVRDQGVVYWDWGEGRAGMIDVRDIADAAVGALTSTDGRFEGREFILTGPHAIGFTEVAAGIGAAIGKAVRYVPVPHEAAKQAMLGMGMPEWIVDGFIELNEGFANGFANTTTDGVMTLAGHPPRDFAQFARDFASVWRQSGAGEAP